MKIYIKVAIAFFVLLFGMVALVELYSTPKKNIVFQLLDQVEENDLAFHADLTKLFYEIEKYGKENELDLASRVISGQVKQQLLRSGLKLKETYFTYSIYKNQVRSFYAEIADTTVFEEAFSRFSSYFDLEKSIENPFLYQSSSVDISIEKHPKYVKINWGKANHQKKSNNQKKSSSLFKKLLQSPNHGVINTTATAFLDSNDFAYFTYSYEENLRFTMDWKVTKNHPLQTKENSIPIYSSQKNKVQAYTNIDLEQIQLFTNPLLKQKGIAFLDKLPQAVKEMLNLWNGQSSLQMGGKINTESIQYITEFDDDFNQVEKKIVKIDSIPDLGVFWGTNQPEKSFGLLQNFPNVKMQNSKLQLALFPPLNINQERNSLTAGSSNAKFKKLKNKHILFINSDNNLIRGSLIVQKSTKNIAHFELILKDFRLQKKLSISSFW